MPKQNSFQEEVFGRFRVISTTVSKWKDELGKEIGITTIGTATPLNNILDLVYYKLHCASIVVELDYVDADYLTEHSYFYCRCFSVHPAKTIRLHFFGEEIGREDLINLTGKDYLGYSVVRPIRSFRTGRTVLKSPYHGEDEYCTLCQSNFNINIAGSRLTIKGVPFIQQDTNVNVCAQASIWMVALYLHGEYKSARFYPAEITELTTRHVSYGPVRMGLYPEQMVSALRDMGYEPLIFRHYSVPLTVQAIYSYVESRLPVIITLAFPDGTGHAVVAVGHGYEPTKVVEGNIKESSQLVSHFCIQDDAVGPYQRLAVEASVNGDYSIEENVRHVIVPCPKGIVRTHTDVFNLLRVWLESTFTKRVFKAAARGNPELESIVESRLTEKKVESLVTRTYLRHSNSFKEDISSDMSQRFGLQYKGLGMPKYLWVTELSTKELTCLSDSSERRIVGEIVMDSTGDRHNILGSLFVVHMWGLMLIYEPGGSKLFEDDKEKPYPGLVRVA